MAIFKNGGNLTTGFNVSALAPIDGRFVADYLTDLIDSAAWSNSNASQYAGLVTYVKETGKLYILHSTSGSLITITNKTTEEEKQAALSNWSPVVDQSDLSKLSGVFTFKGVAEAISPDQSIITTRKVTTAGTDDQGKPIPSESLHCVTTAYEFDMDVYYGWGTSLEDIRFWTDTTTVNSNTPLYDKGKETDIKAYEFNGKLYYPTGTEGKYESIDGEVVYIKDNKVYETQDVTKTSIGDAIEVTYIGYAFAEKTEKIVLEENSTSKTIPASIDNSGHVYQIGENEYASNGQIWVKLGSPVEDWIII